MVTIQNEQFEKNVFERLLTRQQAADFLGISAGTLAVWLCTKRYPLKCIKVGRCVRYKYSDLLEFVNKNQSIITIY